MPQRATAPRRRNGPPGLGRRAFLRSLGAGAAAPLLFRAGSLRAQTAPSDRRPNFVIIVADDLGYGEVSCYPQIEPVRTPNIDRIAAGGVRMSQGYAADPMCWPSRGSILTGRYHQRWGSRAAVPATERMIAADLKAAGYVTGCVGKWHNTASIGVWDGREENHPHGRGFDEFFGFLGGMHDYLDPNLGTHFKEGKNRPHHMPIYDGTEPVAKAKYLTEEFTDRAVAFIERHRAKPFLLYLAYNAKHTPLQAPEKYLNRNGGDVNRAMIDAMDEGVGRVLDVLDRHGLGQRTMVWFVGDNGGWPQPNWHLRGLKGTLFEGGLLVPFLVSWPQGLPRGKTYTAPVMHIDLAPTILAAAGIAAPSDRELDGVNLLPCWRGQVARPPRECLCWGHPQRKRFAVRRGDWKLLQERDRKDDPPVLGLYNLKDDPQEKQNLIRQKASVADELQALCEGWVRRVTPGAGQKRK